MNRWKNIRYWCFFATLTAYVCPSFGYGIIDTLSKAVYSKPIQVVYWVMPGVTPENEARTLGQIWKGLRNLEAVPTSCISFIAVDTLRTTAQPSVVPGKLLIIVGNRDDLSRSGASVPTLGNPGTWWGAVADLDMLPMHLVAMHEVGHAIGLDHTTIGNVLFPRTQCPIMHWSECNDFLLQDDIAALSLTYPEPTNPIGNHTGAVTGRIVAYGANKTPLPGVNIVAVRSDGTPCIAIISQEGVKAGTFDIAGLPPGPYTIRILDAQSYHGIIFSCNAWSNAQIFNFSEPAPLKVTVSIGKTENLGDIQLQISNVKADSFAAGPLSSSRFSELKGTVLPAVKLNAAFETLLHLRGGARPLKVQNIFGLPSGVSATLVNDSRTTGDMFNGNFFLLVKGTVSTDGTYPVKALIKDLRGIIDTVQFTLQCGNNTSVKCGNSIQVIPHKKYFLEYDILGRLIKKQSTAGVSGVPQAKIRVPSQDKKGRLFIFKNN